MRTLAHKPVLTDLAAATGGILQASPATVAGLGFQPSFEQERGQRERRGGHPGPPGGERPQRSPDSTLANSDAATPGTTPSHPSHVWPGAAWSRTTEPTTISPSTPNGISRATITDWWSDTVRS